MSKIVPDPPITEPEQPESQGSLFTVSPHINTETLLANASEDLLSIRALAADLADEVDGSRRSIALAINRMAEPWIIWTTRQWPPSSPDNKTASLTRRHRPSGMGTGSCGVERDRLAGEGGAQRSHPASGGPGNRWQAPTGLVPTMTTIRYGAHKKAPDLAA